MSSELISNEENASGTVKEAASDATEATASGPARTGAASASGVTEETKTASGAVEEDAALLTERSATPNPMSAQEASLIKFRKVTAAAILFSQVVLVILYAALVEYGDGPKANGLANSDVDTYYPFYQDVHVMIFVGFGFLMTFLKK